MTKCNMGVGSAVTCLIGALGKVGKLCHFFSINIYISQHQI